MAAMAAFVSLAAPTRADPRPSGFCARIASPQGPGAVAAGAGRRFHAVPSPAIAPACASQAPGPKKKSKKAAPKQAAEAPAEAAAVPRKPANDGGRYAAEWERLAAWMKKAGVKADAVRLNYFDGLRGLQAAKPFGPADFPVTVPRKAALEATSIAGKCPYPDAVDPNVWANLPWFMRLAVSVCIERRKGEASAFSGWVQLLPERVDVPFFWSDEELAGLGYPAMARAVREQRDVWRRHYDALASGTPAAPFSEQELYSAAAAVCSRAFAGPQIRTPFKRHLLMIGAVAAASAGYAASGFGSTDDAVNLFVSVSTGILAYDFIYPRTRAIAAPGGGEERTFVLCPVIDMANHSSGAKSDVSYEYFYDQYALRTTAPTDHKAGYAEGDQVFISYGKRSNDQLLQFYGFVEEDCPHEIYVLAANLSALIQEYPAVVRGVPPKSLAPRIRALSDSGLLYRDRVYVARDLKYTVNANSAAGLRALLAPAAEWEAAVQEAGLPPGALSADADSAEPIPESASVSLAAHFSRPRSDETEAAVQAAVRAACAAALESTPAAARGGEGPRGRLAARFLREKRVFLEQLVE